MLFEIVEVTCHSGYKSGEYPLSFFYQDKEWKIAEIMDRWYESSQKAGSPNFDYYRVRTNEEMVFILRYNRQRESWAVLLGKL